MTIHFQDQLNRSASHHWKVEAYRWSGLVVIGIHEIVVPIKQRDFRANAGKV
jgi:hypothetical protein